MLGVMSAAAEQAASVGGDIEIADAVRVCLAAGLTFLVMRQVMPMAAGLASGLALSSFGVVSAALLWGFGGAARSTGRYLSSFGAGRPSGGGAGKRVENSLRRGATAGVARIARRWREDSVRRVRV